MDPSESGPERDSTETILGMKPKTIIVGVDAPNLEPLADVEQVGKIGTSADEVSRDESCKILEDNTPSSSADDALCLGTERDLEANTGTKDGDRFGEVTLSIDVKPVEVEEYVVVTNDHDVVSPGENLVDRHSNAFECTELVLVTIGADRNISDIEQADPLEFAQQVAIEVQSEVVECRLESSSLSSVPESVNQLSDNPAIEPETKTCAQLDLSKESLGEGELSEGTLELTEDEPANSSVNATQELESSQITDQEPTLLLSRTKSVCKFDLNKEVCVEKIHELDSSKQRDDFYGIDLNTKESTEPLTESNNQEPSGFLFSQSSVKESHGISKKPKLDLNYATDDSNGSSDCQAKGVYHNINLNDHPSLVCEVAAKSTESMISIFGVNVQVPNQVPTLNGIVPQTTRTPDFGYNGAPNMYGSSVNCPVMINPTTMSSTSTLQPDFTHPHMLSMSSLSGSHVVEPFEPDHSQQTSNLVAGLKQSEPDSGWEPELLPFKQPNLEVE